MLIRRNYRVGPVDLAPLPDRLRDAVAWACFDQHVAVLPDPAALVLIVGTPVAALAAQAKALAAGDIAFHIDPHADYLRIGPVVRPGQPGCLACARRWSAGPWSDASDRAIAAGTEERIAHWADSFVDAAAATLVADIGAVCADTSDPGRIRYLDTGFRNWTSHHVVGHPDCTACAAKPLDTAAAAATLMQPSHDRLDAQLRTRDPGADLPAIQRTLLDRRFGMVREVTHRTNAHLHPMAFATLAVDGNPTAVEIGVGRTRSRRGDTMVSLLEAMERFAGFRPRGRRTAVHASYADVHRQAVDPRAFVLHGPDQQAEPGFRLTPYHEELHCGWVWAYSVRRDAAVLIPEQLAYYNLALAPDGKPTRFVYEISNGCALGSSMEEAALHGMFEVIERDAFLTSWYARTPRRQLRLHDVEDDYIRALVARLEGAGLVVSALDLGVGLPVPAVAVIAEDPRPDTPAALTIASGAHPDPVRAAAAALVEVATMISRKSTPEAAALRSRGRELLTHADRVRISADHIDQCRPQAARRLRRFARAEGSAVPLLDCSGAIRRDGTPIDVSTEFARIAGPILEVAHDILIVDQSFPAMVGLGLRCAKVLVPGLHPMTFGHQYRRVSAERVARHAPGPIDPANHLPHIFP